MYSREAVEVLYQLSIMLGRPAESTAVNAT